MRSFEKCPTTLICAAALAAVASLAMIGEARAVPAFARKYRMSCTTCHAPAPRLKPYGEDFAGNAFRLEDEEPVRFFPDTGDDLLLLQRELPVAVRFDAHMRYDHDEDTDASDFQTPYGVKLLTGGNISDRIGYYLYFYMYEEGEVAGLEDAYLHFNDFFGRDLDLMAGQFQVSDPLFKRELRLTYEDYEIYKVEVGYSPTDLTYDRGLMFTYGTGVGFDAVFEVVNGNGIDEAEDDRFDDDAWKNFLLRVSQSAGPVRLGAFGYLGNSEMRRAGKDVESEIYYWGVDGTVDPTDNLQLNVQYLRRVDENPFFLLSGEEEYRTDGGFAELLYAPAGIDGRHWIVALYNYIESDKAGLDYRSETLAYGYLLRRNLRLTAEVTFEEVEEKWRLVGGFVSAF